MSSSGVNSSEFNSVAQFYQSVLCFTLPLLIIQQCYLWLRNVNQRYSKMRFQSYQKELKWMEKTLLQRQVGKPAEELQSQNNNQQKKLQEQDSQRPVRNQAQQLKTEQVREKSSSRGSRDSRGSRGSKKSNDQKQINEDGMEQQSPKRKSSLPQMMSIQKVRKSMQNIQDPSNAKQHQSNQNNNQIDPVEAQRQKQITPQQQQKIQRALRYIVRIDVAFDQYIPVILSILVLGILTHSVYVFSMVCFFGYVFSALLFNYADLLSKLRRGLTRNSLFNKLNYLISGLFLIALFISYFIDKEYNLF